MWTDHTNQIVVRKRHRKKRHCKMAFFTMAFSETYHKLVCGGEIVVHKNVSQGYN